VSGAANVGRDTAVATASAIGGVIGGASRVPNGSIYGGAIGSWLGGQGYDFVANSPQITIPKVNIDPFKYGNPAYMRPLPNINFYR